MRSTASQAIFTIGCSVTLPVRKRAPAGRHRCSCPLKKSFKLRGSGIFKHQSALGGAPAHKLFEHVTVQRKSDVPVARSFADDDVTINKTGLPAGVELIELL